MRCKSIFAGLGLVCSVSYSSSSQVVDTTRAADSVRAITVLTILSVPPSSAAYIDSSFLGKTPITAIITRGTSHRLQIQQAGFHPFRCSIRAVNEDSLSVTGLLQPFSGSLSIFGNNSESTIKVDGQDCGNGRAEALQLAAGSHLVSVFDPVVGREISSPVEVELLKNTSVRAEYDVVPTRRLILAVLAPGYAQLSDGYNAKGIAFISASVGSLAYMISRYVQNAAAERDYRSALQDYDLAATELAVVQAKNIANRKYDQYQTTRNNLRISVGVVALVWVGNAVDVLMNHLFADRLEIYSRINPEIPGRPAIQGSITLAFRVR